MSEFQTMKAVFYEEYGDISKFQIGDRPKPVPGPKDILIQMKGAGKIIIIIIIIIRCFSLTSLLLLISIYY